MLRRLTFGKYLVVGMVLVVVLASLSVGVGAQKQYRYTIGFSQVVMNCPYYL
ncbi:MAG: hypothetical protein H5T95_10750, partial [Firmicutes bacterium]|nr:hypothetical protein [Bacillota bacterium]